MVIAGRRVVTASKKPGPKSHGAVTGDEPARLRANVARFRHKLERDRQYLAFSRQLLRLYRDGDAARRRGEAAFRLPDFYVIGAPRCATTWVKTALSKHPDILMLRGEPAAFTRHLDRSPEDGLAQYLPRRENFVDSDSFDATGYDRLLLGEKSPDYMTMGPNRLRFFLDVNPHARFVQLCREPGQRLWSHFLHKFADQPEYIDAMLAAASVAESRRTSPKAWRFIEWIQQFGFYRRHIEPWRDLVPAGRLLELSFHDLVDAPGSTLRTVMAFIGADPDRFDDAKLPGPQSATAAVAPPPYLVDWTRELYGDEAAYVASLSRPRPHAQAVSVPASAAPAG